MATQPSAAPVRLHQYACLNCRSKKIKCDNVMTGCSNCRRTQAQCTYASRRPRKTRKGHQQAAVRTLLPAERDGPSTRSTSLSDHGHSLLPIHDETKSDLDDEEHDLIIPPEILDSTFESRFDSKKSEKGRLFIATGKSQYINSSKANQVANLEKILSIDTHDANEKGALSYLYPSPDQDSSSRASSSEKLAGSFLLSSPRTKTILRPYHPHPHLMGVLWEYYVRNVDILLKILYKPTVESAVINATENLDSIDPSTQVLLFAIWFATVTTMSPDECLRLHGEQRGILLHRYRCALEEALVQTNWMTTQELIILQAIILLLACSPGKNTRSTWMLSGIALGIAQAMGMHRDSALFSLGPIEIEVRRRVWWVLCLLDNRISEDCGLEFHVPFAMDTALPLHINDFDLDTDMTDEPLPRDEFTEMTMTLIKIEMARTNLKAKMAQHANHPLNSVELERVTQETIQRIETNYMKHLDTSLYLHRLGYLGTRLIITKLWYLKYSETQQADPRQREEIKDKLLSYNAELLEIAHQLPDQSVQFGWYFNCKSIQWHAMAFLLVELGHQTRGSAVDRAWAVLETVLRDSGQAFDENTSIKASRRSILWQTLLKRARYMREHATDQASAHAGLDFPQDNTYVEFPLPDPFFGWVPDIGEEMDCELLDTLFQDV